MKLTTKAVKGLAGPGRYPDGNGLYLQIAERGGKSWLFRYERAGRERMMGLGPFDLVGLAEAREKVTAARRSLLAGVDPLDAKRAEQVAAKAAKARGITFAKCAEQMIAAQEGGWKNEVHRKQWRSTLETYAYPVLGKLPVAAIDTPLVMKVLTPIWHDKTETASRVRMRIEKVLSYAKAHKLRDGENPAQWRNHLDQLLPAPSAIKTVRHHPAVPVEKMPAFMSELRANESTSARALELTALCALRTDSAIRAKWPEIDFTDRVWTIPPSRMKGRRGKPREHRVPLSDRAVEILRGLRRARVNEFIFPGDEGDGHLSNMAMLELMRGVAPGYVPHGLRSTFKDWASERTNFPNEVSEQALGHVIPGKVEKAYRRGDLLKKRAVMMANWATFCATPPKADNVTTLAERRRA